MSDSEGGIEERVRRRAYERWENAGQPEGRGDEFWFQAWEEVTSGETLDNDPLENEPIEDSVLPTPAANTNRKKAS